MTCRTRMPASWSAIRQRRTEVFCDGHVRAFAFFGGVPKSKRQVIPVAVLCDWLQQRREVSSALQELWKKDVRRAAGPSALAMVRQEYQSLRHRLRKCGNPISGAGNVGSGEESAGHSRANRCMKGAPFRQIRRDVIAGGSHSAPATKSVWLVPDWNASKFMGNNWNSIFLNQSSIRGA